jgi:hypothetical protein
MSQHGLLLKPLRHGFLLLNDTKPAGKSRTKEVLLKEEISLVFDLVLKDALLYNYTQLKMEALPEHLFFFTNAQQRASEDTLHRQAFVTAQDLRPLDELPDRPLVKPFGRIALQLGEPLLPSYYISFQAKATRWCYFLMSEGLKALSRPAVLTTNGNGDFGLPVMITLPDNKQVPVFISKEPVPLANAAAHAFQLIDYNGADTDRYKVIIPALPSPDVSRVSNAGAALYEIGNDYSEIFLY